MRRAVLIAWILFALCVVGLIWAIAAAARMEQERDTARAESRRIRGLHQSLAREHLLLSKARDNLAGTVASQDEILAKTRCELSRYRLAFGRMDVPTTGPTDPGKETAS